MAWGMKLAAYLCLVPKLRIHGGVPPLPNHGMVLGYFQDTFSWCGT